MFRKLAAALLLAGCLTAPATAGHHYYYSYPAYSHVYSAPVAPLYVAPVHVAPVHVAPVVVHRPVYTVSAPVVHYPSVQHYHYAVPRYRSFLGHHWWDYDDVEIEVEWKRNGYEIEIDYDD